MITGLSLLASSSVEKERLNRIGSWKSNCNWNTVTQPNTYQYMWHSRAKEDRSKRTTEIEALYCALSLKGTTFLWEVTTPAKWRWKKKNSDYLNGCTLELSFQSIKDCNVNLWSIESTVSFIYLHPQDPRSSKIAQLGAIHTQAAQNSMSEWWKNMRE